MTMGWFTKQLVSSAASAIFIAGLSASPALAQQHDHGAMSAAQPAALVQAVRDATERYRDVRVAQNDGFGLVFGCVTGPDAGAMGMHFLNPSRLDADVEVDKPEIVIYEPQPDGSLRLVGADYLVLASAWQAKHGVGNPPQIMGQLFQFFDAPNRFELPPFYTLHVWAWKDNPNGSFVNWHPNVSCDAFQGQH